jgi:hypothetical protein
MEYTYSEWHGFRRADFLFEDREALIVFPKTKDGAVVVLL